MKKTLYEILGVKEEASAEEIKEAYIRRIAAHQAAAAMQDEAKFLKDAYDILSDPNKRRTYDASLGVGVQMPQIVYVEEKSGVSYKLVAMISVAVLLGGWYYLRASAEQERLKIERATQLIQEQQALAKKALEQQQAVRERQLDMSERSTDYQQRLAEERKLEQERRYLDQLQHQQERQQQEAERRQKYEEERRRAQEQREAEMRARQAQAEAQRQKAWVEQQERERYGYGYRRY